jgi:hypothetical protein
LVPKTRVRWGQKPLLSQLLSEPRSRSRTAQVVAFRCADHTAGATDHGHIPYAAAGAVAGACVAVGMAAAAKEAAHSVGAGGGEVGGRV